MEEPIEVVEYKGYKINIYPDECSESPDDWGNDDAFVVYDHRDFYVKRDGFDPKVIFREMQNGKITYDGHYYFPLYAYIHGGTVLSLSRDRYPFTCPWDTSFAGFVMVKRQKYAWTEDKAWKIAQGVVNEWNDWLSGNIYGYMIEKDEDEFGGRWGYWGDDFTYLIEQAKSEIDQEIKEVESAY